MGYRAERQADIDQTIAAGDAERQALNRRRWMGAGNRCPNCGDVPDSMRFIDADYIIRVLGIETEAALWDYLKGRRWYRREGSFNIFYTCWQCGPEVPPAEYQIIRIAGGK